MTAPGYYYSRVGVGDISDGLNKIFVALRRESNDTYIRAAACNVIVPVMAEPAVSELDQFIDQLAALQPARFFVVAFGSPDEQIAADISARCQGLSAAEHVCVEVVQLRAPNSRQSAVPEIIRANLLSGMNTKLLLIDPRVTSEHIETLVPVCDQTIFDLRDFSGKLNLVSRLMETTFDLIDLRWISLGIWRAQIAAAFERSLHRRVLPFLDGIIVSAFVHRLEDDVISPQALLMAGWLLERLELDVVASGQTSFECYSASGRPVKLRFEKEVRPEAIGLSRVELLFKPSHDQLYALSLERAEKLEVMLSLEENLTWSANFEDESRLGLLKRYFQVGEVFDHYLPALRRGFDLLGLSTD